VTEKGEALSFMDKWYILQTRPRWEKKVTDCLAQKGVESYCPVKRVKRKWSDRVKTIEEPLFRTCVFVKISPDQRTEVRLTEGVMNFIYQAGRPVVVKEKDMRVLKKHFPQGGALSVRSCDFKSQETGEVVKKSFTLYLNRFQQWLMASMERPKLV
jgi:transcription antitermination factor NusG